MVKFSIKIAAALFVSAVLLNPFQNTVYGDVNQPEMKKHVVMKDKNHSDHKMKVIRASRKGMKWMNIASSKVGLRLDDNLVFINQNGKQVKLSDYFDKPLFVTFMFADCPMVCPTINATLGKAIAMATKGKAKDFRILSISFDVENDNAKKMKEYGSEYTDDFMFWSFGVAEKESVANLTHAFGFSFEPHEKNGWNHIAMVTAVAKGGSIAHQLFGMEVSESEFTRVANRLTK